MPVALNHKDAPALLQGHGLPEYLEINAEQIQAQIPNLLDALNTQLNGLEQNLEAILASGDPIAWEQVMPPLHRIDERLRWSWGVVSHLNAVSNSAELRQAHTAQQPDVVRFGNRVGQSKKIGRASCRERV